MRPRKESLNRDANTEKGPMPVLKKMREKAIEVGGQRAFYVLGGNLKATEYAKKRYRDEVIKMICEYASAD